MNRSLRSVRIGCSLSTFTPHGAHLSHACPNLPQSSRPQNSRPRSLLRNSRSSNGIPPSQAERIVRTLGTRAGEAPVPRFGKEIESRFAIRADGSPEMRRSLETELPIAMLVADLSVHPRFPIRHPHRPPQRSDPPRAQPWGLLNRRTTVSDFGMHQDDPPVARREVAIVSRSGIAAADQPDP